MQKGRRLRSVAFLKKPADVVQSYRAAQIKKPALGGFFNLEVTAGIEPA
jgi:hypothetical protein